MVRQRQRQQDLPYIHGVCARVFRGQLAGIWPEGGPRRVEAACVAKEDEAHSGRQEGLGSLGQDRDAAGACGFRRLRHAAFETSGFCGVP